MKVEYRNVRRLRQELCLCGGCNIQFQCGRVTGVCCFKYLCMFIMISQLLLITCEAKQ